MTQPSSCLVKVLDIVPFGPETGVTRFFALRLERPDWAGWRPGQFVMLRPQSFGAELSWGRPLGICRLTPQHLICFIQVVGRGTGRMARMRPGETVRLWGPLGNGFALEPDTPTLLLAGGMGIVPFVGYVDEHPKPWNVSMVFGHKAHIRSYPLDSLNERITVDTLQEQEPDDLDNLIFTLRERMQEYAEQDGLVLACGPLPFLRTVWRNALELGARTQLSLEARMACGVGACLGCVTTTSESYPVESKRRWPVQVCTHGPVFWAQHINLD